MPWGIADVEKHNKGATTKAEKELWISVANPAAARCKAKGGSDCEASAIRQANAVLARSKEAGGFEAWLDELDEDTLALIEGHIHGLKSSLDKERRARKEAERRLRFPIEESDIMGDAVALREKAVAQDGTVLVKIIQPGWGTSGYYSDKVLERDAPKVFTKGLQMYWDHPTQTEERERPERSLRDLAGELVENARYMPDGAWGPGPYARAKVFGTFANTINELAPHIGVSINGRGLAEQGEAEGQEGPIIQEISSVRSVDFVTVPGAGGKILELFESARSRQEQGDDDMTEKLEEAQKAIDQLTAEKAEALTEIARFKEAAVLAKAKDVVSEALAKQDIPEMTKARLVESIAKNPPIKDGELDEDAFKAAIEEAVKAEMAYLTELAGAGAIRGMGGTPADSEVDKASLKESWIALYRSRGDTLEMATLLAERAMEG